MPSCVHFKARKKKDDSVVRETIVGDNAYSRYQLIGLMHQVSRLDYGNIHQFKRTMGRDVKYLSKAMEGHMIPKNYPQKY